MNIYRTLSLMAAAIFSATAYCQIMPDNTAQVCAYWSEGDSITYDCISKAEKTNRKGEKTITDSSSEKRTLTVIAKDDNSYTLQVSYKDVYSSNLSLNLNLSIEDYSELCSSVKYNVITNEFGTLQELGDLEQSLETMRAIISLTMDKVYAGYDKKTWKNLGTTKEQVIKYVTDSFCTPEAISQSCIADISPLLFFHGGRYKMDEEYVVEEPYTNIFGEGQANGETHFWVDTEYSDSTYLVMRTYTKIDGEKIMPMLRDASLSTQSRNH